MQLDLTTKTVFAEFQEAVLTRFAFSRELDASHTYVKKRIKGEEYWYTQKYVDGKAAQKYFGPRNKANDSLVMKQRQKRRSQQAHVKKILQQELRLAAMLKKAGLPSLDPSITKLMQELSSSGLIAEFGILVGSLAFSAYSGVLGTLFNRVALKTNDIDIVNDTNVKVAVDKIVDIRVILKNSGIDFHEVPGFSKNTLPTFFSGKGGLRLDLLTPDVGKAGNKIFKGIKGAAAQALPYLDFLIKEPIQTVLICPKGGIPVKVPHPVRFAIHKMVTSRLRPAVETNKKEKDLLQAGLLIPVLVDVHPYEFKKIWKEANQYSKKLAKYLKDSLKLLSNENQEILLKHSS